MPDEIEKNSANRILPESDTARSAADETQASDVDSGADKNRSDSADSSARVERGKKSVWISAAVVAACMISIVVALLVIFVPNDGKSSSSHVKIDNDTTVSASELDIKLIREKLECRTIGPDGFMTVTDGSSIPKDFSHSDENIFGINSALLIGPRCYFEAHMAISNNKPYAFEYWLEIVPGGDKKLLADQLELTVTVDGKTVVKRTLGDRSTTATLSSAQSGDISRFVVKLEYLDDANNNATQNSTLTFDMTVHVRSI